MFSGSIAALVTPMKQNGSIDLDVFRELIDWHITNGTDGLVVLGTTGEAPTITYQERKELIKAAVEQTKERIPVIAGTGTNNTQNTIDLTKQAKELGVDACLLVTPYYNKPTQEGLYQHYAAVAKAVAVPQLLYNVPGRTGVDLLPDTVIRLAELPNIIGLKDATGEVDRVKKIANGCGKGLDLLTGDDQTACEFMLAGGKGSISVTANIAPKLNHEMCELAMHGKSDEARALQDRLMPLHKSLFVESNPIPVKWLLADMGKIPSGIRLPLTALAIEHQQTVKDALKTLMEHA